MKTTIKKIIALVNKLSKNKKLFYYSPNINNSFGKTAVKTKFGFWYVGDVLDQRDIACGILNFGLVEPEETELMIKLFKYLDEKKTGEKINFFDIGANTGYYGLLAASLYPDKIKVSSFEPVKEFADCIKESIEINHFANQVEVHTLALSDSNTESTIYVSGTCSSLEKDFNEENLPSQKVILQKLDNISNLSLPDIMKIDVEGHELKLLEGSVSTIKQSTPIIFMEVIHRLDSHNFTNKNFSTTMNLLSELGYRIYIFKDGVLEALNNEKVIEGVHMYLFLHDIHKDIEATLVK